MPTVDPTPTAPPVVTDTAPPTLAGPFAPWFTCSVGALSGALVGFALFDNPGFVWGCMFVGAVVGIERAPAR